MPLRELARSLLAEARRRCRTTDRRHSAPTVPHCRYVVLKEARRSGVELAVVIHLYYLDVLPEVSSLLRNVARPFDLYVTTPHAHAVSLVKASFHSHSGRLVVCVCENRGRDVGPFVRLIRDGRLKSYSVALKLHSKKSAYSDKGSHWRQSLYDKLLGSTETVQRTLALFDQDLIGMVGPHDYYLSDKTFWGANELMVRKIMEAAGDASGGGALGFFAGTMFWFRPAALRDLVALSESVLAFEPETGMQDGTLAHALERAFAIMVRHAGYVTTSLELGGRDIQSEQTFANRVPVLP